MKSLLVTWYENNVGSSLQAMALQRTIQCLGLENDICDYRPSTIERTRYYLYNPRKLLQLKRRIALARNYRLSPNAPLFEKFYRNEISWSSPATCLHDLEALSDRYEVLICGSDQVWKPTSYNPVYYLDFGGPGKRRVAYAVSFGVNRPQDVPFNRIEDKLKCFRAISLREDVCRGFLSTRLGMDVPMTCDPTLLLDADVYRSVSLAPDKDGYTICYLNKDNRNYYSILPRVKQVVQGELILYAPECQGLREAYSDISAIAGPAEWLGYIEHARAVITDSYHGVLFALLFGKPFIYLDFLSETPQKGQNSRIIEALEPCQELRRMVRPSNLTVEKHLLSSPINDVEFKHYRCELANRSAAWLAESLHR